MKNIIVFHSYNGDTIDSFAPSIEKLCKKLNINYIYPKFPIKENASYESWCNQMREYSKFVNEETILIAHSLGTQFAIRYLAERNIKIHTYISVAGFYKHKAERKDLIEIGKKFLVKDEDFIKCRLLMKNRYSIYSDNDELNSVENMEKYACMLEAFKIMIHGAGHFNPKSGIKEIKEINEIILKACAR